MSLQTGDGNAVFIRPVRVHVDSSEAVGATDPASQYTKNEYTYKVRLPEVLTDVIGVRVTAWNLPNNMGPSFISRQGNLSGNDYVDVTLTDTSATFPDLTFSIRFPQRNFSYINVVEEQYSYIDALAQLLNSAVAGDANYGGNILFSTTSDPDEKTIIVLESLSPTFSNADDVQFTLLFSTGANAADSAADNMGFAEADYTSSTVLGYQQITSPNPVALNEYRYVDIYIKQFPQLQPVARIYLTNLLYSGTTRNDFSNGVEFLLSNAPKPFSDIEISLRLKGGRIPLALNRDHDLTLVFYQLEKQVSVPQWVTQVFTFG